MHLLGEPVAQRWSDDAKREIRDSRVLATRNLVAALRGRRARGPRVLVSQSASGWYGARGDERVDESEPAGGRLPRPGRAWTGRPRRAGAEELGMRVALTRTGVVLSESGGALEKMLPPFKLGVGGPVAGGRQYVPWIHIDDVVGRDRSSRSTPSAAAGPVNLSAPEPVTNKRAVEGARPGAAAAGRRPGAGARGEAALRRDGPDRDHGRARGAGAARRSWATSFRQADLEDALRAATGR